MKRANWWLTGSDGTRGSLSFLGKFMSEQEGHCLNLSIRCLGAELRIATLTGRLPQQKKRRAKGSEGCTRPGAGGKDFPGRLKHQQLELVLVRAVDFERRIMELIYILRSRAGSF
jgi:hypothetical protein